MTMKYKAVKVRKNGYLKRDGHRRTCMRPGCKRLATHNALRAHGLYLEVWYCLDHAQQAGLV